MIRHSSKKEIDEALGVAVMCNNERVVQNLLQSGADPNYQYDLESPLEISAKHECPSITSMLINNNADLNKYGPISIYRSIWESKFQITEVLLRSDIPRKNEVINIVLEEAVAIQSAQGIINYIRKLKSRGY